MWKNRFAIGVDPGKSGGIVVVQDGQIIDKVIMPVIGKEYDTQAITAFLLKYKEGGVVYMENLHAIFGVPARSNFELGRCVGIFQGIAMALKMPLIEYPPKEWQKFSWAGIPVVKNPTGKKKKDGTPRYKTDTKKTSLLAAKKIFPAIDFTPTERAQKPHDGLIDAGLIAWYGYNRIGAHGD